MKSEFKMLDFFKWLNNIQEIVLCDTWEQHEIQRGQGKGIV